MQVVGHQQGNPAMPRRFFMIMRESSQNPVSDASATELIHSDRDAINRNKKPTSTGYPLRNGVRKSASDW